MVALLTAAAVVLAAWVAARSGEPWTGVLPALVVVGAALAGYALWVRRGRPWHDWAVILLVLPAVFASVWIAVGGLLLDVARTDGGRLALEVGPGVGLTGLLCTLISYHGRHDPRSSQGEAATGARTQR